MKFKNIVWVGLALVMSAVGTAQAGTLGSLGLTDAVGVTVGTPGDLSDITLANTFNFQDLQTTAIGTGIYTGIPITDIGAVTFTNSPTGLFIQLGSTTFQSDTVVRQQPNSTNVIFTFTGLLTNGGTNPDPIEAILNFNFSQVGGAGNAITGSGTLVVPSPVPEPSTMMLGALGLLAAVPFARRKKAI